MNEPYTREKVSTYRFALPELKVSDNEPPAGKLVRRHELDEPIHCMRRDVLEVVTTTTREGGTHTDVKKLNWWKRELHHAKNWFYEAFRPALKLKWLVGYAIYMRARTAVPWRFAWQSALAEIELVGEFWDLENPEDCVDEELSNWDE